MQRRLAWLLLGLLCIGGLAYYWRAGEHQGERKSVSDVAAQKQFKDAAAQKTTAAAPFQLLSQRVAAKAAQKATNASSRFAYRLSNTTKTVGELAKSDKAILMANALIDTSESSKLAIPEHLRARENNGSYIVQARGPIDNAFRASLQTAGAEIVSYVPNNAYLVRMSDAAAAKLSGKSTVQSVLEYEPYYKLDSDLIKLAVEQKSLQPNTELKVTLFPGTREPALNLFPQRNLQVTGEEPSPFGPVLTMNASADALVQLAQNPMVQGIQLAHARVHANDLMRGSFRISQPSWVLTNYLNLTGSNVMVNLNDSGVDKTHFDLTNRVFGDFASSLVDTIGHGTHVAGTIAGSGIMSSNSTVKAVGSLTNANFRGMAPSAKLYSLALDTFGGPAADTYLQEQAAKTNAFISNNSWGYVNAFSYTIEAASYDAAVRDALPQKVGSQPLLFVFSAGNEGSGEHGGINANPDTILSPGTAKNVITVGALEQPRFITNDVVVNGFTNKPFLPDTDASDEVAYFSSRGNVGIGIEGEFGRFKPDVVAPGTFVVSDRSGQWDTNSYYSSTNYLTESFRNLTVDPSNLLALPALYIPDEAVGVTIYLFPNKNSPNPFPDAPIYLKYGSGPTETVFDLRKNNSVSIPQDGLALRKESYLFVSVGNPTNEPFTFNAVVELAVTNDYGNYFDVLKRLDDDLGPYYRYSSGTSMAAAGVSGFLALMQEFFEQRAHITNSPALMKALLINGARSAGTSYDLQVQNGVNHQGWGLPNITNSVPQALTNLTGPVGSTAALPIQFFDQSPTNALATGQQKTRNIKLSGQAVARPLRVTLVWTDPPGNPNVGIKLVNDLDLIVTNLDTGDVYFGNDITALNNFNLPWIQIRYPTSISSTTLRMSTSGLPLEQTFPLPWLASV